MAEMMRVTSKDKIPAFRLDFCHRQLEGNIPLHLMHCLELPVNAIWFSDAFPQHPIHNDPLWARKG